MNSLSRQSILPKLETIKQFMDVHGPEETDREFGLPHEFLNIRVVGHQQFSTCIVAKNSVLGGDNLLDSNLEPNDFVLLKIVEGRDGGYGINAQGDRVTKDKVSKLYGFINSQPRVNGQHQVHPDCSVIRSEEQIKNASLSSADIQRCTNMGCVFHFSAEAFVRICRMHGISLSSESAGLAFVLQVELEMRRRAYEEARTAGNVAFLDVLDADYRAIDIIGCLESLVCKLFTTACTARCIRQSFDNASLSFETSIISTINAWLGDNGQEPKETIRECLEAVLSDSDLAVCLNSFIRKIFYKISLKAHTDKTVGIRNPAEKALLESIFRETNENCINIRKFLFTGSEDDPLVSSTNLDRYRRVFARSLSSLQTVNQARETNVQRLANCAWAELFRGEAEESSLSATDRDASSTELTNWFHMTTALQEYVVPSVLSGVQAAHKIAPDVVEALVVATVDARKSGDDSGVAELALVQLAFASGANSSQLVETKGCVGILVASSFPQVHNAMYPKLGEELVELSNEDSRVLTLVRTVETGIKAETEIAHMDADKKETEEDIVENAELVSFNYSAKQEMLNKTHRKMKSALTKHTNKIFSLVYAKNQDEESFYECMKLFNSFAYDEIEAIIFDWKTSTSKDEIFIGVIRTRFVAALNKFDYDARTFFQMEDRIKSTINAVHNRREVKAAGSGRRSNAKIIAEFEKHSLPSALKIAAEHLKSKHAVFEVSSKSLSTLKKEDRDACVLHGCKYKIRETFLEEGTGIELTRIIVFRNPDEKLSSSELCSENGAVASSNPRDYVLIDYRTISEDGLTCLPFGSNVPMTFETTTCPIANTRGVKCGGRVVFDDGVNKVCGRNKRSGSKRPKSRYGSGDLELSMIKSFITDRHGDGPVLHLIGVVEDDLIVGVLSGNEPEYQKIVNKILRDNNSLIFGSTKDVPTVYEISMERKKSNKSKTSSRFVSQSEDDLAMIASDLANLEIVLTPLDELKMEFKALSKRDLDEDDVVEKARLDWLEERIANPPDESETHDIALILSDLASKVVFSDNQTRDDIIQALKIGFGEWTHPDNMIAVEMSKDDMMDAIASIKTALMFAFNGNQLLFQKMLSAFERFYAGPIARYEEDEDGELVVVKPRKVENNNYTPLVDEKSFYKTRNPEEGKKSGGRVSVGGGRH